MVFTDPTNRVHEGFFSTSSCADETKCIDEEDIDELSWEGSVVDFFTKHAFVNIPVALATIMEEYEVEFACSACILNEGSPYWSTGEVGNDEDDKIQRLHSHIALMPVGHVEQLLCAGFAFLYQNGGKSSPIDEDGNSLGPPDTLVLHDGPNDIQLFFKFEGQKVCLQIMSECPWGEKKPCVHLAAGSW